MLFLPAENICKSSFASTERKGNPGHVQKALLLAVQVTDTRLQLKDCDNASLLKTEDSPPGSEPAGSLPKHEVPAAAALPESMAVPISAMPTQHANHDVEGMLCWKALC